MSLSSEEDILTSPAATSFQSNTNKKRRVQNQRACDRCRLKKSRSLSLGIPIAALCSISLPLSFGVCRRSPLSVCFFCCITIGRLRSHSAGDGTPSRAKCTHCTSSNADCIFTEPTKVRSLPPSRSVVQLNTLCHRPEVLQNGISSWRTLHLIPINSISEDMSIVSKRA